MSSKRLLLIVLFSILILSVFVSSSNIRSLVNVQEGVDEMILNNISQGIKYGEVGEGWNLVNGFFNPKRIINYESEILEDNIKAVYLLKQPSKEYVRLYPEPEYDKLEDIRDSDYKQTAQWVFSNKNGKLVYLAESPSPLKTNPLHKGWNLLGITYAMYDKYPDGSFTLNSIKGSCDIEEIYLYSGSEWENDLVDEMDRSFDNSILMNGFAVKVLDYCWMGLDIEMTTEGAVCIDSEEGSVISETGEITYTVFGTFGTDESEYVDVCIGGTLNEYYCEGNALKQEIISCGEESVCRDGRCIEGDDSLPFCVDSDGGRDFDVKGKISGNFHDEDGCYNYDLGWDVYACSGETCGVHEYYCCAAGSGNGCEEDHDSRLETFSKCSNGCEDGACLP